VRRRRARAVESSRLPTGTRMGRCACREETDEAMVGERVYLDDDCTEEEIYAMKDT
jgi:hypothetical protein